MGCPVATDHKSLLRIFNDRDLDDVKNPRLQALKERTLMYDFDIVHVPGKKHCGPDATSRYPGEGGYNKEGECSHHSCCILLYDEESMHANKDEIDIDMAISAAANMLVGHVNIPAITWDDVKMVAAADEECLSLSRLIGEGFPSTRSEIPELLRYYWNMQDDLYVVDGVPFKDHKLLVPHSLRKQVVDGLHCAHQSVNSMLANARRRFFWPGIDAQLR